MPAWLDVENLTVSYRVGKSWLPAVRDFRLRLMPGEIVGLVGESGCGKSTVALALMRYLSANGRIEKGGKLRFAGQDLLARSSVEMRRVWAKRIKYVPQNAGAALNPSIKIGAQVSEALQASSGSQSRDGKAAHEAVIDMFQQVNLVDPQRVAMRYPHELSGGMQQRAAIAMALISNPQLLILDEPTTGLDVTTEAVILDLLRKLIAERDASVITITHNLGVVAQFCQRVVVLYAGEIMEEGEVQALFAAPRHPYTRALIGSVPKPGDSKHDRRLHSLPGHPPSLARLPRGCVFAGRCPLVVDICRSDKPPLESLPDGRSVRCHRWEDAHQPVSLPLPPAPSPMEWREGANDSSASSTQGHRQTPPIAMGMLPPVRREDRGEQLEMGKAAALLRASHLSKHFPVAPTVREAITRSRPQPIRAVDGVDLQIRAGQTLGLVGESGSGKTTLARVIIGLQKRSGGQLELLGMDVRESVGQRDAEVLSKLQMVFQNPQNSLNPYHSVRQAIRRPLIKLRGVSASEADAETLNLLERVNLRAEYAERYPDELSGGEKQRVAIARAFASQPELILCDEPVSALDVSVQAAVLNLLADLQAQQNSAYLFISHNLSVVGYLADSIAVMYLGQIVEAGAAQQLFQPPFHPYTEALVSAIPVADPQQKTERILLSENLPSAQDLPSGCRFHTRCPRKIGPVCEAEAPPWQTGDGGHAIRCHIPLAELAEMQRDPQLAGKDV